jgi:predicted Zn finger-like uncharacterized protein
MLIHCPTCHKAFTVQDDLAGRKIKCTGCSTILQIPAAPVVASPSSSRIDGPEKRVKKKKKSTKTKAPSKRLLYAVIGGGLTLFLAVVVLAVMYIPWGSFSGKDLEIVDAYTAVNALSYHDVGERALQSKLTALAIPGRKKIIVTRANPEGGYIMMKLKIPYKDVDAYFPGSYAASRPFLIPSTIQLEAGGEKVQPMFAHEDNAAANGFQLDYAPRSENARPLPEYLGPSKQFNWTHDGELTQGEDGMIFKGKRGMLARIRVGGERQDGNEGGNPFNTLTGRKIFKDQDGLVSGPGGYIHVSWNQDSGGWIIGDELEQPNEIGRYWHVTAFFPRPKARGVEATLTVLKVPRKLQLP